jgi:hypothetical protein
VAAVDQNGMHGLRGQKQFDEAGAYVGEICEVLSHCGYSLDPHRDHFLLYFHTSSFSAGNADISQSIRYNIIV